MEKNYYQGNHAGYSNLPDESQETEGKTQQTQSHSNAPVHYNQAPPLVIYPNQSYAPVYPSLPVYVELPHRGNPERLDNDYHYTNSHPSAAPNGYAYSQPQVFQSVPAPTDNGMLQQNLPRQSPFNVDQFQDVIQSTERSITLKLPQIVDKNCFKPLFPRNVPREPMQTQCPGCNHDITTKVNTTIGLGLAGFAAGLLCCCCYTAWIPFAMQDCYDIKHRCPDCDYMISEEKFLCK